MSAAIISGKTLAAAVKAEAAAKVCALQERGVQPCLAVVLVGENPARHQMLSYRKVGCTGRLGSTVTPWAASVACTPVR